MSAPRRGRRRWLDAALVAAAALAVHGRTLAFGWTGLDDRDLVVDDAAFLGDPWSLVRAFSPARAYMHVVDAGHAYWRPLVTASYALDAQWGGARPLAYHATNVALHATAAVLVLAVLRRLALGRAAALAAALVFAVHPALAAAVAWVPGRCDSLLAVTALAACVCLLRRRRALHLVFFAGALLSKETAMALPLVWAMPALLSLKARARAGGAPWLPVAWLALVAARVALHPPAGAHAGAHELLANAALLPVALGQIALPRPAVLASMQDAAAWPGVVAAALLALATWRLRRVRRRVVLAGAGAFVLLLAPSMLVAGTLVLDSRLYLPAVGALAAAAEIARAAAAPRARASFVAFAGVAAAALAVVTMAFESAYRDPLSFGREAVAGSPRSPLAHFCLGQALQRAGDDDRALAEYAAALDLGPAEVVHNDVAVIHMKRARWPDAERELRAELEVNPGYAVAYANLAVVLRHEGRLPEACEAARRALAQSPDDDGGRRAERDRDCAP